MVGAVCHGPAGFLSAHRADGTWLFAGRTLTGFTNEQFRGRRDSRAA
jgi:putative intracellular protease/amidase